MIWIHLICYIRIFKILLIIIFRLIVCIIWLIIRIILSILIFNQHRRWFFTFCRNINRWSFSSLSSIHLNWLIIFIFSSIFLRAAATNEFPFLFLFYWFIFIFRIFIFGNYISLYSRLFWLLLMKFMSAIFINIILWSHFLLLYLIFKLLLTFITGYTCPSSSYLNLLFIH